MKDLIQMPLPIILLILVFLAVAIRKIGPWYLPIWLIMLIAATITLLTGQISIGQAYHAISFNVLFYLFGVFVIGQALESSHYLEHLSLRVFSGAKSLRGLLGLVIIIFGLSSALLMNDTIAIIGVPVIILLSTEHDFDAKPFLLALAYSITLGSVFSPIGNPQNLLIASQGMGNPFVNFSRHLVIPTLINLVILYVFIKLFYGKKLTSTIYPKKSEKVVDKRLSRLCQLALGLMLTLILLKVALSLLHIPFQFNFSLIAIIACLPILLFSNQRLKIIKHLDWHTLLFFVGLFIFIESVWLSGYFQMLLKDAHLQLAKIPTIFAVSLSFSQLISNVPLVALYLPLLKHASTQQLLALAVGSTLAGNLLILGAASNVIIVQNAEKRKQKVFSFWEFLRLGFPLTVCNILVYYFFLR